MPEYPKKFLKLCQSVTAKRPKTVIDHILSYGQLQQRSLKIHMVIIIRQEL